MMSLLKLIGLMARFSAKKKGKKKKKGRVFPPSGNIYSVSRFFSFFSLSMVYFWTIINGQKVQSVPARKKKRKRGRKLYRLAASWRESLGPCAPYPLHSRTTKTNKKSPAGCWRSPDETDYRCNKWHVIVSFSTASNSVRKWLLKHPPVKKSKCDLNQL